MKTKSDIFNSPAEGNKFGGLMADNMAKGMSKDQAAKAAASALSMKAVDNPMNYGTGSPFKLMRSKIFKK